MIALIETELATLSLTSRPLQLEPGTRGLHLRMGDASEREQSEALLSLAEAKPEALRIETSSRTLPPALGELRSLRQLHIIGHELAGLPKTIARLERLRSLRLDTFHLLSVPKSLGRLTKLVALHVDSHHLGRFPSQLAQLVALREFGWVLRDHYYLKDWGKSFYFKSRFEQPPDEVFRSLSMLPELHTVYLREPPERWWHVLSTPVPAKTFRSLSPQLATLTGMRRLILHSIDDPELPGELAQLEGLEIEYRSYKELELELYPWLHIGESSCGVTSYRVGAEQ